MTFHTVRVLLELNRGPRYGLEIARATGLKGGSLYPILSRLEEAGWVQGEWEGIDPHDEGRPPRRYYAITDAGAGQMWSALAEAGLTETEPREEQP